MRIYHGSDKIVNIPMYGYGKSTNDYGRGFYCTEKIDLAYEWSVDLGRDGYVNGYELECDGLSFLDLEKPDYCLLDWLAILMMYRDIDVQFPIQAQAKKYIVDRFYVDVEKFDVIKGYRADDSFFSFARAFLSNTISYEQLARAMHLGELGTQIVLKSEKAFEAIKPRGYTVADSSIWYERKKNRDLAARKAFLEMQTGYRTENDIYMLTILREEIGRDDARIQRIIY